MNKKLVIFDIDGTLLDHEKIIPTSTKEAIVELQSKGINVAIATGRAPFMFEELRQELKINTYICYNGQYVIHEGEVIYKNSIESDALHTFIQQVGEKEYGVVCLGEKEMMASQESNVYIEEALASIRAEYPPYDPTFHSGRDIYQALLFCKSGEEFQLVSDFNEKLHFIRWHEYSVDVLPAGGSKGNGITQLVKKMGLEIEDVYAFGDGLNDVEMIQLVGNGIVMGNGVEELKVHAQYVTKNVDEDGILHGLKWAGLL